MKEKVTTIILFNSQGEMIVDISTLKGLTLEQVFDIFTHQKCPVLLSKFASLFWSVFSQVNV